MSRVKEVGGSLGPQHAVSGKVLCNTEIVKIRIVSL